MNQISAPYRFVPLSRLILLPDWATQVSHDQPFADGVCGELNLHLTCHTALCVGGHQEKSSERETGKVHFFRTPDGQPAIPGSSLKGMLRNVLEIASFARFKHVEDKRLDVRDISDAKNFYHREIVSSPVKSGWMRFIDGQWQIQPCEFSRLHQEQLIEQCKVSKLEWKKLTKAVDRYKRIGTCPTIRFDREAMLKKNGHWLATPTPTGHHQGHIVVTGQPGNDFEVPRAKKYEFVFHDAKTTTLKIAPVVMTGFRQIHEGTVEWKFWSEELEGNRLPQGIPVFFHMDGEQVKSIGLAMMYKLPYTHSLHDAIRHSHDEHLSEQSPDLPDLIFGYLGNKTRNNLRGRVNIGLAILASGSSPETKLELPCILNSPKPTFYPAYIRQDGKGSFRQLMESKSELSGWKRYPVKDENILPAADESGTKVQVRLETLPAATTFMCTLRFHNLRRVELGALLWALDFGGKKTHRHALGMGKPFGLGQVSLAIHSQRLRSNDPNEDCQGREAEYLFACRREFIDLMDQTLRAAGQATTWEGSEPIKALLEYAKPARSTGNLDYLATPKAFVDLRRKDCLEEWVTTFHTYQGVTPNKGFDTTQPRSYDSRFGENLQQAGAELQKQAAKIEREQRKAPATVEDGLLQCIEDWRDDCQNGGATTSTKGNLAKCLQRGWETAMDMDDTQKAKLRQLAEQCNLIDNKKIQQACRKILRDV